MRLINHVHACLEEIEGRSSSWLALSTNRKTFSRVCTYTFPTRTAHFLAQDTLSRAVKTVPNAPLEPFLSLHGDVCIFVLPFSWENCYGRKP